MAGQGRKTFSDGEVLSAADVNGYLMDQSVMRFADSTARTAAIGTPTEGMVSYLDDTNNVEVFDGSGWVNFTGDITNITAGTGLTGGGSEGAVTLDVDFTAVQENVITTQGDLVIGDVSGNPVRLPVGTADQVLTSDGTTVSFQDAGGGGGGQTLLSTTTLTGTEVAITNIDQSYKDLKIYMYNFRASDQVPKIELFTSTERREVTYNRIVNGSTGQVAGNDISFQNDLNSSNNNSNGITLTISNYSSDPAQFIGYGIYSNAFDSFIDAVFVAGGVKNPNNPIEELRFINSGTWAEGTVEIYGVS